MEGIKLIKTDNYKPTTENFKLNIKIIHYFNRDKLSFRTCFGIYLMKETRDPETSSG